MIHNIPKMGHELQYKDFLNTKWLNTNTTSWDHFIFLVSKNIQ